MGRSERLRLSQVRAVFRLVGEVRELGADTLAWRSHMVRRLCALLDAPVGMGGEIPPGSTTPTAAVDMGWGTARDRREWREFIAGGDDAVDPVVVNAPALRRRRYSLSRRQLAEDRKSDGTNAFELRRRAGLDDCITSSVPLPVAGWDHVFMLMRPLEGRPFSRGERRLADLFHRELARLWRTGPGEAPPPEATLSPRQRQVLACLLNGDGEKQAARKLDISVRTAHNHVTALHRHFGVHSRSELMATCRGAAMFRPRLQFDAAGALPFAAAAGAGGPS
jgi:DNA-binding CsgD family transcriptional regulator